MEPFRNAPTPTEIRNCLLKLFELHSELQRKARRDEGRVQEASLLANLRLNLEASENLDDEDRELIMNLSPAYLQWREEVVQQGIQQGIRLMVESMLEVKFGVIDEDLSQIVESLMQLSAIERTQLIMQLSREELLDRF